LILFCRERPENDPELIEEFLNNLPPGTNVVQGRSCSWHWICIMLSKKCNAAFFNALKTKAYCEVVA
jgi:hypothetical protein